MPVYTGDSGDLVPFQ